MVMANIMEEYSTDFKRSVANTRRIIKKFADSDEKQRLLNLMDRLDVWADRQDLYANDYIAVGVSLKGIRKVLSKELREQHDPQGWIGITVYKWGIKKALEKPVDAKLIESRSKRTWIK